MSHNFFGVHGSSAGSRLFALLLGSYPLSTALWSSRLLWLWSPRLTGPLGEFYLTLCLARSVEKLMRDAITEAREGERTEEPS